MEVRIRMYEWKEFSGKNVDDVLKEALLYYNATNEQVEYEIIERESRGFLGINSKPARIRMKKKLTIDGSAKDFLDRVFTAMEIDAKAEVNYDKESGNVDIEIVGDNMGVLIGKRGQTLDSLQYLTSLVINKESDNYYKVKIDTENYRERRKETLENLAKNIAIKVKRIHKPVSLEPMNPYERRIIHSTLQNDKYVDTHSEGEEPYRKVVITPKKGLREFNSSKYGDTKSGYGKKYGSNIKESNNSKDFNHKKFNNAKPFDKKANENSKDYSSDYKKDYAAYLEQKAAAKAAIETSENETKE